jgi:hypothetical protein
MPSTRANKGQFGKRSRSQSGNNKATKKRPSTSRPVPVNPTEPKDDPAYINTGALNVTKWEASHHLWLQTSPY